MGAPQGGDSELPALPNAPRNRNVKCKGRTVIRYKHDDPDKEIRKGDPILDEDGRRQYRPCEAFGAHGTDYCTAHGGSAPQTIAAAKRELSLGALEFAEALRAIASDERIPPETRIKAINSGLDRIGIRTGVDVALEAPGWQKMLAEEFGQTLEGDRAEPVEEAAAQEAELPQPPPQPPRKRATKAAVVRQKPKFEGW